MNQLKDIPNFQNKSPGSLRNIFRHPNILLNCLKIIGNHIKITKVFKNPNFGRKNELLSKDDGSSRIIWQIYVILVKILVRMGAILPQSRTRAKKRKPQVNDFSYIEKWPITNPIFVKQSC